MKKTMISYEIHNLTTHELLLDNLQFDEVPELIAAYQLLYPAHEIVACYREITITERVHYLPKREFKYDWFELLDNIIDNLYNS